MMITQYDSNTKKNNFIQRVRVMVMVFNATFNNISAMSWRSVSIVAETGAPEENHFIYL